MGSLTERIVTYWAVSGERWCNVDGFITAELAERWSKEGWRIVTLVEEYEVDVFGEVTHE